MPAPDKYRNFDHPSLNYRPPRELRLFRVWSTSLLVAVLLVGLWSAWWLALAAMAKKQLAAAAPGAGITLVHAGMKLGGYPLRVVIALEKPLLQIAGGDMSIAAERAEITINPWSPWRGSGEIGGKLAIGGKTPGGAEMHFSGRAGKLEFDLNPGPGLPDELSLRARGLSLARSDGKDARLSIENGEFYFSNDHGRQRVELDAETLELPWNEDAPIPNRADKLDASLRLSPGLPVATMPGTGAINDWRESGGRVLVDRFSYRARPYAIDASGRFGLDASLRPEGAASARITGLLPAINRLRDMGFIRDSDAVVAKMTLAALSNKADDGTSFLNLSLSARDGILYLGPAAIVELEPVAGVGAGKGAD